MSRLLVPVPLRWADLDAYGHVNNVAVLRLLEEARIAAFWRHPEDSDPWPTAVLDGGAGAATHTFVASTEIEYLLPLGYHREPVTVETWLGHLGGASIDVCYQLTTVSGVPAGAAPEPRAGDDREPGHPATRRVHIQARTTLVLVDASSGRPRRITPAERSVWLPYLEEPVSLRRRRP